jgi:sec-independent protein translocase protein TatA
LFIFAGLIINMMSGSVLLFLSNLFSSDMLVILVFALLLFGGEKLPEIAKGLGKGIRDFKDASEGVKREINAQINSYEEKRTDTALNNQANLLSSGNNYADEHKPIVENTMPVVEHTIPVEENHFVTSGTVIATEHVEEHPGTPAEHKIVLTPADEKPVNEPIKNS